MDRRAEACLLKAAACERAATLAYDPTNRELFFDLARQWRDFAAQAADLQRLLAARAEKNL
jgi:hypothetical protein